MRTKKKTYQTKILPGQELQTTPISRDTISRRHPEQSTTGRHERPLKKSKAINAHRGHKTPNNPKRMHRNTMSTEVHHAPTKAKTREEKKQTKNSHNQRATSTELEIKRTKTVRFVKTIVLSYQASLSVPDTSRALAHPIWATSVTNFD